MEYNIINRFAFSKRVLAVAVRGSVNDWAAYIDSVPGHNHANEQEEVARSGEKLPRDVARLIFPHEAKIYQWRD